MQFLHVNDAATAVEHAARRELAGLYNVAGPGTVRWRRAARLRRTPIIDLPPVPSRAVVRLWRGSVFPRLADDLFDVLRFGRCVDTDAIARTGFWADHTSEKCVVTLTAHPSPMG